MKTQHYMHLTSFRNRVGFLFRESQWGAFIEILFVIVIYLLKVNGFLPMSKIPVLILGSVSLWLRRNGWRQIGMDKPKSWTITIFFGAGIAVLDTVFGWFVTLPLLHQVTGEVIDLQQLNAIRGNTPELLFWFVISWIYAALAEEMVYRGYLLNRLADLFGHNKIGWILSIIISSLMFGFVHGSMGITGVLNTFLSGVLYAVAYLVFGHNLWIPIIIHGVGNSIGMVMIYFGLYP